MESITLPRARAQLRVITRLFRAAAHDLAAGRPLRAGFEFGEAYDGATHLGFHARAAGHDGIFRACRALRARIVRIFEAEAERAAAEGGLS